MAGVVVGKRFGLLCIPWGGGRSVEKQQRFRVAGSVYQRFSFLNEFIEIGRALGRTRDSGSLLKWDSNQSQGTILEII